MIFVFAKPRFLFIDLAAHLFTQTNRNKPCKCVPMDSTNKFCTPTKLFSICQPVSPPNVPCSCLKRCLEFVNTAPKTRSKKFSFSFLFLEPRCLSCMGVAVFLGRVPSLGNKHMLTGEVLDEETASCNEVNVHEEQTKMSLTHSLTLF